MDITPFLNKVNAVIVNPLITLAFAIALLVFFFGIFQFINTATESVERDKGKKKILYGLIGMFVMFSAYGLIHLVLGTFGIDDPSYLNQ